MQALTCPSVRIQIQSALLQHLQTLAGQQLSDIGQLLPNLMIPHVQGSNEGHSRQALVLELKPKWGLMPDARWLQAAHAAKLQHSRFELMQKLKAAKAVRHSLLEGILYSIMVTCYGYCWCIPCL